MASYDYNEGKKRIEDILNNTLEVIESDKIPKDENFTFSNAHYGWVTGVFIDIRDSSTLFSEEDKAKVSKIVRSFTSEIIEILRDDDNLREIGIRGDCVYGIYTTPYQNDIYEIVSKSVYINTFLKMLNQLLSSKYLPNISVGIGVASAKELVVKAGRKGVNINNNVWIGDAVTMASNLSSLGSKNGYKQIVMTNVTYDNIIKIMKEKNPHKNVESWFTSVNLSGFGMFYHADVIDVEFSDWIDGGMK